MYKRVYVEITNICNMHCSFCHGHGRAPRRMEKEEFSYVLQQLCEKTEYIYYHLMGEPLLHPLLPEFLKMAAHKSFRSVITTNGTLLDKRGDALIAAEPHKVSISLHSFESHDQRAHLAYLSQVADFAEKASAAGIIVSLRLWNKGFDEVNNAQVLDFFKSRFTDAWQENLKGYRIRDRLYLEWGDRFQWPDKDAPIQAERFFCHGMQDQFGILCDGTVVPCCLDSEGVIALGNVFQQDLSAILSSPRAQAMVEGFRCRKATENLCRRCGYAQRFV